MSLIDQHWIKLDGEPVTGRVPTQVRVMNDQALSDAQSGAVAHVYKLFCYAKHTSIAGFLTQDLVLNDGSRVRMVSNNGVDTVMVWPPKTGETLSALLRGFVTSPFWVGPDPTAPPPPAATLSNFLCFVSKDGTTWKPVVHPYSPGERWEAIPYLVTATPFTGDHPTLAPLVNGRRLDADIYVQTVDEARRAHVLTDDEFNDVYATYKGRLYRNAVPVKKIASEEFLLPVVFPITVDEHKDFRVFLLDDTRVQRHNDAVGATPANVSTSYDFSSFYAPVVPGRQFRAGVDLRGLYSADFFGLNRTNAGAVQFWTATAELADDGSCSATEAFGQIGVPGVLNGPHGWTSLTHTNLPRAHTPTGVEAQSGIHMVSTGGGNYAFGGYLTFSNWRSHTSAGSVEVRRYLETYAAPESINLPLGTIEITRTLEVDTRYSVGADDFYGVWEGAKIENANPAAAWCWPGHPGAVIDTGWDALWTYYHEGGDDLVHADVSIQRAEITGMPLIVDLTLDHEATGKDFYWSGSCTTGTTGPGFFGWSQANMVLDNSAAYNTTYSSAHVEPLTYTHDLNATTRDYFYADRDNEVYGYVESVVASASTGGSSLTIYLVLKFGDDEYRVTAYSSSSGTQRQIETQFAWGINWGTSDLAVQFAKNPRIDPIYAPLWQEQGLCPYIAYTTAEEDAGEVNTPRHVAHFRLQLLRTQRTTEPPALDDVVQFAPYCMEQMVGFYCVNALELGTVFTALEAAAVVIKAEHPALFAQIEAPTDDAHHGAKFYRT